MQATNKQTPPTLDFRLDLMSPSHQVQLQPLFQLSMLSSLALHNICFCNMRSALPFKTENFSRMQNLETRSWFPIAGAKDLIS